MQRTVTLPEGIFLGAASSAWQTEGWVGKKDNQDSYMDLWYKKHTTAWHNGYGPTVATNFIERYQEDVDLMKAIGLQSYRTSLNWSRFLIDYENVVVDEEYAAYYDKMLDACIAAGVEPMVCLEHYELPAELFEKYGGWASKHVVDLYVKYAEAAFQRYGKKVKYWFAFNEPVVVQTRVYLDALRWPFERDTAKWMAWNYNKALATNRAMKVYKEGGYRIEGGKFGTILNVEVAYPRSKCPFDQEAADMFDLFYNKVFLDPAIKGEFPRELFTILEQYGVRVDRTEEELKDIRENTMDWIGLNLYHPNRVKGRETAINPKAPFHPNFFYEEWQMPGRRMNPHRGWEIGPEIIYDMGLRMRDEYGNIDWFISESGMGVENEGRYRDETGTIQDDYRIDFLKEHIDCAVKAANAGSNCKGYMLWAFTDNVSPQNAFKNRYGLVEIDLEHNRDRRLKKSAAFYKETIQTKQFTLEDPTGEYK